MKCPFCKGRRFTRTGARYGGSVRTTFERTCQHCDGTGEIQEDDVWIGKCGYAEDLICVYRGGGWHISTEWDMHFVEDFEPQCRMKKVIQ